MKYWSPNRWSLEIRIVIRAKWDSAFLFFFCWRGWFSFPFSFVFNPNYLLSLNCFFNLRVFFLMNISIAAFGLLIDWRILILFLSASEVGTSNLTEIFGSSVISFLQSNLSIIWNENLWGDSQHLSNLKRFISWPYLWIKVTLMDGFGIYDHD